MGPCRVFITGIGIKSALGRNAGSSWQALVDKKCAIKDGIGRCEYEGEGKQPRWMELGIAAAQEAVEDANLYDFDGTRAGVCMGTGIGSIDEMVQGAARLDVRGKTAISPFFVPRVLANMCAGHIAIEYGLGVCVFFI